MKKVDYHRKPFSLLDSLGYPDERVEKEMIFHLIGRILRLMTAFGMRTQLLINNKDVHKCSDRLFSETNNHHE